jgi:ubiquinone/menaquinone biosynthesis C-methylase UbiE
VLRALLRRIVAQPVIYDRVQRLAGLQETLQRLRPLLERFRDQTILDVGAGTGNCLQIMPPGARYVWLDNDPQKLHGFQSKGPLGLAMLGDATRLALRDESIDVALCCGMSHHLTDEKAAALFRELARVCRSHMIFLDAIAAPGSRTSNLLWKYDRGSHPRTGEVLRQLLSDSFHIVHAEQYKIYHTYVLCVGEPRRLSA